MAPERKGGRKLSLAIRSIILKNHEAGLSTVKIAEILKTKYDFKTTRQSVRFDTRRVDVYLTKGLFMLSVTFIIYFFVPIVTQISDMIDVNLTQVFMWNHISFD